MDHLFFDCPYAQAIWRGTQLSHPSFSNSNLTFEDKFRVILQHHNDNRKDAITRQIPLWTMWRIWKSRNLLVYQRRSSQWLRDAQQAITDAYE